MFQAMSGYGFEIVQTLIVDIEPDQHVKRSMNEINAGTLVRFPVIFKVFVSACLCENGSIWFI